MARHYKNFLRILEKWPLDTTKGDRDLGVLVRERVKQAFPNAEASSVNNEECEKTYQILKRLVDNHNGNLYKRSLKSSSTGLSAEECRGLLSNEFLQAVKEEERGLISRLFRSKEK